MNNQSTSTGNGTVVEGSTGTTECYFIPGLAADGKPFTYSMHRITGIRGGPGPGGSIKSQSVKIVMPRSRKAAMMHLTGFTLKLLFFLIALFMLKPGMLGTMTIWSRLIVSLSVILAGGGLTLLIYQVNKTRSKFFFASSHPMVKAYRKDGYRRGFHPMMSSTPAGVIAWMLRLVF